MLVSMSHTAARMKTIFLRNHVYIIQEDSRSLGAKTSATFDPAALQDLLARFGIIAFHEAMLGFTLAFVWLISSFWHIIVLSM